MVAVALDSGIQYAVVGLEVIGMEHLLHRPVRFRHLQRLNGAHQPVAIGEMLVQEMEYHVAALFIVARIHGNLPEQVFDFGIKHCQRPQAIPQVVEHIDGLYALPGTLILGAHETAAKLYGGGKKLFEEFS